MNAKDILAGIWHCIQGMLIIVILGMFIMWAFFPCLEETAKLQMEVSHDVQK